MGLDIDRVPLFGELLELFGVQRVVYEIDAFEPLPDLGQQFDWITAFSTNFYLYHPAKKRWETAEWDFFLRDLQHHLAPGGKIFFGLNPLYQGGYYTPEIRDLFLSRGAEVERERAFEVTTDVQRRGDGFHSDACKFRMPRQPLRAVDVPS